MKILLINPSHLSIGSRLAGEHLPPLGLLSIGGPLIDAGYAVNLLDADYENLKMSQIVASVVAKKVDIVMLGHSGSSSAQPVINEITQLIRQAQPEIRIIVGGIFPTFHWKDILQENPQIDYIVCGEGEKTILELVCAIEQNSPISNVKGIAYLQNNIPVQTSPAEMIENLELFMQMRPKALKRLFFHRDARLRSAMRWYTNIGRRVWFWELYQFFFVTKLTKEKITLEKFWNKSEQI